MSEPEIDRRCTLCGATVRARAAFCPQCGQQTSQPSKAADTQILLDETPAVVDTNDTIPLIREPIPDLYKTQPLSALPAAFTAASDTRTEIQSDAKAESQNDTKAETQNIPRASERGAKARVDKIRKASSLVIDQAAYDPSLRFVLVAACFFLLFLFLLLMSKVLG